MEADLVFFVDAPTPEIATMVAKNALDEFRLSTSASSMKGRESKPTWLTKESALEVKVAISCETREQAYAINEQLKNLIAKHQRAAGVFKGEMGSLAVGSMGSSAQPQAPRSGRKWWKFWE